jgi:hypothetical protein
MFIFSFSLLNVTKLVQYCRVERSSRRVSLSCVLCTMVGSSGRRGKLPLPSPCDETKLIRASADSASTVLQSPTWLRLLPTLRVKLRAQTFRLLQSLLLPPPASQTYSGTLLMAIRGATVWLWVHCLAAAHAGWDCLAPVNASHRAGTRPPSTPRDFARMGTL